MTAAIVLSRVPEDGADAQRPPTVDLHGGAMAREVRAALTEERLELDWQPIVPANGGPPVSYEVLVRLRRTDGTRLAPGEFLGAAEDAGIMPALDRHVLTRTIAWLGRNAGKLPPECTLSVNVSGEALTASDFVAQVIEALATNGVPGQRLCLEITESMAIEDVRATARRLRLLRSRGVTVALDDFGTGYSSLGHLSLLPADILKIDGMFVLGMLERNVDAAIVRGIIDLGHSLDMDVVAEYVEDDARLDRLRDMGVDHVQGYAFGRPVPLGTLA